MQMKHTGLTNPGRCQIRWFMHKLGLPPFCFCYYYCPSRFFHSLQPEVNNMLGKIKRLLDHWQWEFGLFHICGQITRWLRDSNQNYLVSQKGYKLEPCYLIHKLETRCRLPDFFLIILLNFDGVTAVWNFCRIYFDNKNFVSKISWKLLELGPCYSIHWLRMRGALPD